MVDMCSDRKMRAETGEEILHERGDHFVRLGVIDTIRHRNNHAHQCAVGSIRPHSAVDQVQLGGVLARYDMASHLVPEQHDVPAEAFLNDVPVDLDALRASTRIGHVEEDSSGLERLPSSTRETLQRRMNRLPRALALVEADVQRHGKASGALVYA